MGDYVPLDLLDKDEEGILSQLVLNVNEQQGIGDIVDDDFELPQLKLRHQVLGIYLEIV